MIKNMDKKFNHLANTIRALSFDAIERANSGHPGLPMGMADVATVLFSKYLKFDVTDSKWLDRDRFILSAGHGSMLLYSLSYLVGYKDISINQIKKFRNLHSKTAGHPEFGLLKSIETTTGPLGQGVANAVGMALSEKILNSRFGKSLVNHRTWVMAGDGCLMEGISQESISIAGHLKLNKLVVIFDNNGISIDGETSLTTSDDHIKRFQASNWNTISIDGHDYKEIDLAFKEASQSNKPTLISCKTIIGYGSPNKSGKSSSHGSPLGADEVKKTREKLKWNYPPFVIPKNILNKWRSFGTRGTKKRIAWEKSLKSNKKKSEFLKCFNIKKYKRNESSKSFLKDIINKSDKEATRKSSQNAIEILSTNVKNFIGGSADLTGSNLTKIKSSVTAGKNINYIYYGVREHLMAGAMNGISLHGGFIPYGGTFLIFSDYCKNSIRLSALMKQQVIYVFTHDSIGLGEDGPTHQPIEQLAGLRAIPNLLVLRPCDAVETFECWEIAINEKQTPSCIALSRQSLPLLRKKIDINYSYKGAYFLSKNKGSNVTLIATGSEVSIAKKVYEILLKHNIKSNIISMPSLELFDRQEKKYRNRILGLSPRIVIEAASSFGWHKYLRDNDSLFCIDTFGESGKAEDLYNYFGLKANDIAKNIVKKYF